MKLKCFFILQVACLMACCDLSAQVRIVVLGSSTAEGAGVSSKDSSWVVRVSNWLADTHKGFEVVNLAKGGYTTCQIMPTHTKDYHTRDRVLKVDTLRNIDKALSYHPKIIIINMPTNDTSNGIPPKIQMNHFKTIIGKAKKAGVDFFITTSQPHNFGETYRPPYVNGKGLDQSKQFFRNQFKQISEEIMKIYKQHAIDFYTGIASSDGLSFISPIYNSGDGVHLNDKAHRIFADRVINKLKEYFAGRN